VITHSGSVAVRYGAWIFALMLCPIMATFFWLLWNWLAPIYFYWLPDVYHQIPWWHCVGIFWLAPILRTLIWPGLDIKVTEGSKK
jgi:hypothetical protein